MRGHECRKILDGWRREGVFDLLLPEVAILRDVPQPEDYHAEGDVFTHTMIALEAVDDGADQRVFWGVLLHDIGKASTTAFIDGRWRSHGHAEAGAGLVPPIMKRIGFPELAADVSWLVRHHLFHFSWHLHENSRLTKNQRRFMENPLFRLLLEVCFADAAGSAGCGDKGRKISLIAEMYDEEVSGEKGRCTDFRKNSG